MDDAMTSLTRPITRRELLARTGTGLGILGLAGLLQDAGGLAAADPGDMTPAPGQIDPLAPKRPHFRPRAKRLIHVYLNGGPSHIDTFDPKPLLEKYAGKPLPSGNLTTERKTGAALPSPFKFQKRGESGIEVSELFPEVARHI